MELHFKRREFLRNLLLAVPGSGLALLNRNGFAPRKRGRITIASVSVYSRPSDESTILYQRTRDEIINLYEDVISDESPQYNPLWYRVWRGYIHAARVQEVQEQLNQPVEKLPEGGVPGELTVPVSYPLYHRNNQWTLLYPLYYQSVHWITDVVEGPDQLPWYQVTEAWSKDKFYLPAEHIRLISEEELAPLSPEVPPASKRIRISLMRQTLTAFEEDQQVFSARISSGLDREKEGEIPWRTPSGNFMVTSKMPSQRMGEDPITADISGYVLPGVPWVCFFHNTGVALHGTYWHNNYGVPMSHGCVNMTPADAKWIFRWVTPLMKYGERESRGNGTRIQVAWD